MSTRFINEGNIGSNPEYKEFANGNEEPRRLLRINVRFDNPIPIKEGGYQDRGGFWAPVELWHPNAEAWSKLYQKGMRVLVDGRMVQQEWEDETGKRSIFKVEARNIAILPYRVLAVTLEQKSEEANQHEEPAPQPEKPKKGGKAKETGE